MRTTAHVMTLLGFVLAMTLHARAEGTQPANVAPLPSDEAMTLAIDKKESSLVYHLIHKLHRVDGKSKAVDGRARLAGGSAQVMIRVPVESFDSENTNRDQHMKEAVEAEKYPLVELRAVVDSIAMPAKFPTTTDRQVKAQIIFHGVSQTFEIPIKIVFESATRVRATASFALSLDAFKVERPSLMFVKVNDKLEMDATLVFNK